MSDAEILAVLGDIAENKDTLPELAEQMGKRAGILPFVGAGLSSAPPFRYPQWGAFLLQLAEEARTTASTTGHLQAYRYEEAAAELQDKLGGRRFQDLLAKNFGDERLQGKQIGGALRELTRLPQGVVITTNFDRLLERVFEQAGRPLTPYTYKEATRGSEALQSDKPFLLKLHGDWDRTDSRVLTLPDYEMAYGAHDAEAIDFKLPLPTLLFQLLSTRCCLFLGCSLKQDRTMRILRAIASSNPHLVHYAIVERPADEPEIGSRAVELSNQAIRPIWFPHTAFDRIAPLLAYLAGKALDGLRRGVSDVGRAVMGTPVSHNIPDLPNATIGREHEVEQLTGMLRAARLITIVGPAGCGKSRLAVEVANQSLAEYGDGIWFVPLDELAKSADKEGVLSSRVGRVIGVHEQAGKRPHLAIAEHIGEQRILLVLDNCEHLIQSCRDLVAWLLSVCPNLTVLATSRRPMDRRTAKASGSVGTALRLPQERLYPLAPLEIPTEEPESVASLASTNSVRLFTARVREQQPDWQVTPRNAEAVARLCRALDGIPLAIEVAAARLPVSSAEDMLAACEPLIGEIGNIDAGDLRHWKTLSAALRWSYGLLGDRAQQFMRTMAVFDGGWTESAAETVYAACSNDKTPVREHHTELLSNSLLIRKETNGVVRFRFLKPIRQILTTETKAAELSGFRRAHADYFVAFAELAAPEMLKAQQKQWMDKLALEVDNFRAVFRWCVANIQPEHGLRLFAALWRFVEIRGYLVEGRMRALEVLGIPGVAALPARHASALSGAGMLAYRQGEFEEADEMFHRCLAIETELGNDAGRANALNDLGNIANMRGDFALARKRFSECLEIEQRRGNARAIAVAKFNLGAAASGVGDYQEAEQFMTESLREFRAGGNHRESSFPLNGLAQVSIAMGNAPLGEDYAQASLDIRNEVGDPKGRADALRTLAWAALEMGAFDMAAARLTESIHLTRGVGDKRGLTEALELVGVLHGRLGRHSRAVEALGAAEQARHGFHFALPPIRTKRKEAALSEAREKLGELEYERAWKRGSLLEFRDAVDRALKPESIQVSAGE